MTGSFTVVGHVDGGEAGVGIAKHGLDDIIAVHAAPSSSSLPPLLRRSSTGSHSSTIRSRPEKTNTAMMSNVGEGTFKGLSGHHKDGHHERGRLQETEAITIE